MKNFLIIIHHNDFESLNHLVDNVKDYKIIDKVLVYDNASEELVVNKLKNLENDFVEIIYDNENKGYSYAINKASKYLIDNYGECNLIVSNCDVIIKKEEDIAKLVDDLKISGVGLVAPTIKEKNTLNHGWKQPKPKQDILLSIIYFHRFFEKKYVKYPEEYYKNEYSFVDVVSGCMFAINSTVLQDVNFFDDNVFLYYEENILCKKLKSKNYKVLIDNEASIIHNHSVSINKNLSKIKKYKILKKSQYYFEKNYNNANLFELCMLKIVNGLSGLFLRIKYLFEK